MKTKKRSASKPCSSERRPVRCSPTMLHLMIDLETMSTEPNAAVVAIGAVLFDPYAEDTTESLQNSPQYYATISLESNAKAGRHICPKTITWWLTQSQEARERLITNPIGLDLAITGFRQAFRHPIARVWAKDPDFDCVILRSAMAACGQPWPWSYWANRSVRTLVELAYPDTSDIPLVGIGVIHTALDDAITQALLVQACYHQLYR